MPLPVVIELLGNLGSVVLIAYYSWALFAHHHVMMAVVFAVVALVVAFSYPMVLNNLFFSTKGADGKRRYVNAPQKPVVKALGMLLIPFLLAKLFGAW